MTLAEAALSKVLDELAAERRAHAETRAEYEELKAAIVRTVEELEHSNLLHPHVFVNAAAVTSARSASATIQRHEAHRRHLTECHQLDARPTPPETPSAKAIEAALRDLGPDAE